MLTLLLKWQYPQICLTLTQSDILGKLIIMFWNNILRKILQSIFKKIIGREAVEDGQGQDP